MSRVMKEDARRYFEAAAASAEARDERRFSRAAERLQAWLQRSITGRSPQAI
ncbi:MAG TPA: hypothetical protein VG943_14900 [Caulobacterales bacterium]|nr:hypothetical protein [Caulobacterales bacterium]